MNYYGKVKAILENYNELKANISLDIDLIKGLEEDIGLKGVNYDSEKLSSNLTVKQPTEDLALYYSLKKEALEESINTTKKKLKLIDDAIGKLKNKNYQKVIRLKYIEESTWEQIARALFVSEGTCRYWKDKALKKLVVTIYGLKAI